MRTILIVCFASCIATSISHAATALEKVKAVQNAGFVLTDYNGKETLSKRAGDAFIPASTTKLLTAWLALSHWGEEYRFTTPVYLDQNTATLWIKGNGDPFLVSEEINILADQIKTLKPGVIKRIGLDVSLFDPNLSVPGATITNNPYDAIPTALSANFNTLNLRRIEGKIESAEPQTPLTPYSRSFADQISGKSLRINTGRQSANSERYFAELLSEVLRRKGVSVGDEIVWGDFPNVRDPMIYQSSRTLGVIVEAMLKYSTNFIANQLMLTLAAQAYNLPANFDLVQRYMESQLTKHFNWQSLSILEGAGLSRQNRVTPIQMIQLLIAFKPWEHLLPEIETDVFAKTGTLNGVSTLAGFIRQHNKPNRYFSILINDTVSERLTRDIALELAIQ